MYDSKKEYTETSLFLHILQVLNELKGSVSPSILCIQVALGEEVSETYVQIFKETLEDDGLIKKDGSFKLTDKANALLRTVRALGAVYLREG